MKNISFDNPYWLLIAVPLALLLTIPFIICANKDNRSRGWKISLAIHLVISVLIALAAAGLSSVSVLTKTDVYVLADVSDSSERNLERIDEYVSQIEGSLPVNSKLGVVCFAKNYEVLVPLGRQIVSVSESRVDTSATNIADALSYTGDLFRGDSIKRIVIITDGNDTVGANESELAAVVSRLVDNGVKVDAVFLDNSLAEGECEVQLSGISAEHTAYLGGESFADVLIQASDSTNVMLELYKRQVGEADYIRIGETVISAEAGLNSVKLALPTDESGSYEYRAQIKADSDISLKNNELSFAQNVVGKLKILHVTGKAENEDAVKLLYAHNAEIDTYVVGRSGRVPFTVSEMVRYDEIILSDVDVREISNANAFIDSIDTVVSQYGKSLITLGDLYIQTEENDVILNKLEELLPLEYGSAGREGRLYTIVLDVSHSMFMAYKFTIAKEAAIKLLSLLEDEDYVALVTFSGKIEIHTPDQVKDCRRELVAYIDSLTTGHGTDIGLGLEEALNTVKTLNMQENQVMLISDGFSFDNKKNAVEVAGDLFDAGVPVSVINTYVSSDGEGGRETLRKIVGAGEGGNYYEISSPERVESVVFGSVSNEVTQAIVRAESSVNIVRYKDPACVGISSLPDVSVFIQSIKKYDATVPLTVNYAKGSSVKEVPLYAYRAHGNGSVSSLATSLADGWCALWSAEDKSRLFENIIASSTPDVRIDHPFSVELEYNDYDGQVVIVPGVLDPEAVSTVTLTRPDGTKKTATLTFDGKKYTYLFDTGSVGTYNMTVSYESGGNEYSVSRTFYLSYLPEYNAFANFDKSVVYGFMRGNGSISEDGIPNLENDKNELSTYKRSFAIPLLIAAVSLFVLDIAVRKFDTGKKKKSKKA